MDTSKIDPLNLLRQHLPCPPAASAEGAELPESLPYEILARGMAADESSSVGYAGSAGGG